MTNPQVYTVQVCTGIDNHHQIKHVHKLNWVEALQMYIKELGHSIQG